MNFFSLIERNSKIETKKRTSNIKNCLVNSFYIISFIGLLVLIVNIIIKTKSIASMREEISIKKKENDGLLKENKVWELNNKCLHDSASEIANDFNRFENNPNENKEMLYQIFCPYQTAIIRSLPELTMIRNWIQSSGNIHMRMVYQASIHGDNAKTFHSFCDKLDNSLVLIKDDQGNRFGGFTTKTWRFEGIVDHVNNETKEDPFAFVFNLGDQKKYKISDEKNAIVSDPNTGPYFGPNKDLMIVDNFLSNYSISEFPQAYGKKTHSKNSLTNQRSQFKIIELEIFEIAFYNK